MNLLTRFIKRTVALPRLSAPRLSASISYHKRPVRQAVRFLSLDDTAKPYSPYKPYYSSLHKPYSSPYKVLPICIPEHVLLQKIIKIKVQRGPGIEIKSGDCLLTVESDVAHWNLTSPVDGIVHKISQIEDVTKDPKREIAQLLYIPIAPNQLARADLQKKSQSRGLFSRVIELGVVGILGTASLIMLGFTFFCFSEIYDSGGAGALSIAVILWLALLICCIL